MTMHVIEEGPRNLVIRFYDTPGANLVDVSTLNPPCDDLRILKIIYDSPEVPAAITTIDGDATADVRLWTLSGPGETYCFQKFGGIVNNAGAGKTGDILVTTGDVATSLVIHFRKVRTNTVYN